LRIILLKKNENSLFSEYSLGSFDMSEFVSVHAKPVVSATVAQRPVGNVGKRAIDIVLASSAIIILAPLLVVCFLAIIWTSPGAALFRHRRVGFGGKHFGCFKFRTMVPDAESRLQDYLESDPAARAEWATCRKLRFDPRITAIGAILRKTSLDELPQLFNVIKGDMSIVGPRPVTDEELTRYSTNVHDYLACRPGITGLWQVSGRSGTTYAKRVACDSFYARNWSIALDAKIVIVTLPALLDSDNAY
jgi:exopolysaccharide production protein ExoY